MEVNDIFNALLNNYIKFFFLLTPFAGVSIFLAMTSSYGVRKRHVMAVKTTGAVITIATILYFFGTWIFGLFGITIDAFRIGAGVLLFLSGIDLVKSVPRAEQRGIGEGGRHVTKVSRKKTMGLSVSAKGEGVSGSGHDDAGEWVVPLAIPIIVGPATIAALLVIGSELKTGGEQAIGYAGLMCAILTIGLLLYGASAVEKVIGQRGLTIFSKLTGWFFVCWQLS